MRQRDPEFNSIWGDIAIPNFGCTAKDWQEANPELAGKYNMRDTATINQLVVLSNMESANSELIKQGLSRQDRYDTLHRIAQEQLSLLDRSNAEHKFRKLLPGAENSQLPEK